MGHSEGNLPKQRIMKVLFLLFMTSYTTAYPKDYDYTDYDYDDYDHDYYYFYDETEYFLDYGSCENDEFCVYKEMWVDVSNETKIGNSSLVKIDYDYHDIRTDSAINECTPSLGIKDFADTVLSCQNLSSSEVKPFGRWALIEICEFRKMDWLKEDGTIDAILKTKYSELEGVSEQIASVILGNKKKNEKRSLKAGSNIKLRKSKMGKSRKSNIKNKKGKKSFKNKKKSQFPKGGKSENYPRGKKVSIGKMGKVQFDKIRSMTKQKPKKNKGKSTQDKNKLKKEKKKFLKSVAMTSLPTLKVLEKLEEIHWKITSGLEECVEKVLSLM